MDDSTFFFTAFLVLPLTVRFALTLAAVFVSVDDFVFVFAVLDFLTTGCSSTSAFSFVSLRTCAVLFLRVAFSDDMGVSSTNVIPLLRRNVLAVDFLVILFIAAVDFLALFGPSFLFTGVSMTPFSSCSCSSSSSSVTDGAGAGAGANAGTFTLS